MKITRDAGRDFAAAIGSLVLLGAADHAHSAPGDTEKIAGDTASIVRNSVLSRDGRFFVYSEWDGRAHNPSRVRLVDRWTGDRESLANTQDGHSSTVTISADARYAAFISAASDLVPNDTNAFVDIFVRDRLTQNIVRVNSGFNGAQANAHSSRSVISADGRYVAFVSGATNLVSGDTNGVPDVFVADRQTLVVQRVNVGSAGTQADLADSGDWFLTLAISGDGRYVAFDSPATNLVPNDTNGSSDVFVRDRLTSQTERVSISSASTAANGHSFAASISADGRYVAFRSTASNLVPGDSNNKSDVFVRDRQTGRTERISVAADGTQANGDSNYISLSADGRFAAFESDAPNLVPEDIDGLRDVFVRDRESGRMELASVASEEDQDIVAGVGPSISSNGRYVIFANPYGTQPGTYIHEIGLYATRPSFNLVLKPVHLNFGNQALWTTTTLSFWLTNTGTNALPIAGVGLVGLNPAMFSIHNRCGTSVAVGASCSFRVTFRPTSVGDKSAKLRVVAGDNDVRTRGLTGSGVHSTFTVSQTSLDFGSTAINTTTVAKVVTISNTGGAALSINSITLDGWNPYQFAQRHDCPAILAVGSSCTINVAFKPTATGSKAALLNIIPSGGAAIRSVVLAGAARR